MTIPVPIGDVAALLGRYGSAYLLTTSPDGRTKVVAVDPVPHGPVLRVATPGRGSVANLATHPGVTVIWPPLEPHGFTLIVDGSAAADDAGLTVTPERATLHRPAAHADGPEAPYPL